MDLKAKANPREQILVLLVVASIFLLYLRLVAVPKRQAKMDLKQQIKTVQVEKEALEKFTGALIAKIPEIATRQGGESPPLKILRGEQSPHATETASLLEKITQPRFLEGITVKEMSHLPPESVNGYAKSGFFLEVQGSYPQLTRYLEELENFPALMVIENITLKSLENQPSLLSLSINGILYHFGETNHVGS